MSKDDYKAYQEKQAGAEVNHDQTAYLSTTYV